MESNQNRRVRRYFKCSNCKLIDSILLSPSNKVPKCAVCQSTFKEISESEFKEKKKKINELIERTKQENNRQRDNPNRINNPRPHQNNNQRNRANRNRERSNEEEEHNEHNRGNSLLHYSRMNINNMNDINDNINFNINNNNNINNINFNNINENNRGNRNNRNNNNINRNQNNSNHHHHHTNNNNRGQRNNNQNNRRRREQSTERRSQNNLVEHIFGNILRPMTGNPMIIFNQNRNPFRIVIQRQNVPNSIFDPFFVNFGSVFNGAFQDNFSSNFRSNYRGNFMNEILRILEQNQNEARRHQHHPTSKENLNKLKQFNMSEKYCKKEGEGKFELPNCCICIDEIAIGQKTILLPCGHMFHNDCIVTWLKKNNTCPMCRFEIK